MSDTPERIVYEALKDVYAEGKFSSVSLTRALRNAKPENKAYITMLFYGVLDKSIQFDYIISSLAPSKPKTPIAVIIKIGLYLLRYTDTPSFAAVDKTVELTKSAGKGGVSGFVNALLKKSDKILLPEPVDIKALSICASYPEWIVKKLTSEYGFDFTKGFLLATLTTDTHIRINRFKITKEEFIKKYPFLSQCAGKNGYYVTHNILNRLKNGDYIIQSEASMIAVQTYLKGISPKTVLDLCAAPGGKAVYIKECLHNALVTACDIHPHRLELINRYLQNAGTNIEAIKNDAVLLNSGFIEKFDLVVCDVPCSGLGVASKKPEILWNKTEDDIRGLSALQGKILDTASNYVNKNGRLSYSTCTVLKEENENVCQNFLKTHKNFKLTGNYLKLFPHIDNCDGFFVANFERIG